MIGVIGFGRFGHLTTRYLAGDFRVKVYSRRDRAADIRAVGGIPAGLATACRQKVVILCTPISTLKSVLTAIAPHLTEDALVIDVCSVKAAPTRWMRRLLPPTVAILATHPMFGPDSAAKTLAGCKIFLCPERIDTRRYEKITAYLRGKGLVLIEASADEHDRQIALSLSLTHFIGRSLARFGAAPLDIDTEGYKRLLHILGVVDHDTWQLFVDMHRYNPYARKKRREFMAAMHEIDALLEKDEA